jgi:hypothetical protein
MIAATHAQFCISCGPLRGRIQFPWLYVHRSICAQMLTTATSCNGMSAVSSRADTPVDTSYSTV